MAQADITIVTESQLPVIVELYNQIFRPTEDQNYFRRRFQGRYNVLVMLASLDNRPIGFCIGFELKPLVFYTWLIGVHADFRRSDSRMDTGKQDASPPKALHRGISATATAHGCSVMSPLFGCMAAGWPEPVFPSTT